MFKFQKLKFLFFGLNNVFAEFNLTIAKSIDQSGVVRYTTGAKVVYDVEEEGEVGLQKWG